jgi:hypothetical protein
MLPETICEGHDGVAATAIAAPMVSFRKGSHLSLSAPVALLRGPGRWNKSADKYLLLHEGDWRVIMMTLQSICSYQYVTMGRGDLEEHRENRMSPEADK